MVVVKSGREWVALIGATVALMLSGCAAQTKTVQGTANIYASGHNHAPAPGNGGGGTFPTRIEFPVATGDEVIRFSRISGQVFCDTAHFPANGADGGKYAAGRTEVYSWGGLSGITHRGASMFLVGVFLGKDEPRDPAPAPLDFTSFASFTDLRPALGQVFFIGDGLTGTGTGLPQVFHVPAGASQLCLGFADAWAGKGAPGWYGDNGGSLKVEYRIGR